MKKTSERGARQKTIVTKKRAKPNNPIVVGIGASAGGLEALREFFGATSKESELAYVVIQHLAPDASSNMAQILAHESPLKFIEIKNNMQIKANTAFILPPNYFLAINENQFKLIPRSTIPIEEQHSPIDYFFRSMANDLSIKSIGVVLSGLGSDGTAGVKAISFQGGITFAQNEGTAQYFSMPEKAIASGCIDFVLSPSEMPNEILRIVNHRTFSENDPYTELPTNEDIYERVLMLVKQSYGLDFKYYKPSTVGRRIQRRMALNQIKEVSDYVVYLEKHNDELTALYNDLLIKVTHFFRDPEVFETLKSKVFLDLVRSLGKNSNFRIWIPGCSTGEEPYSMAIAFSEFFEEQNIKANVQIFATDLSERAIEIAREGFFAKDIEEHVSKERLNLFFIKKENGYQVKKSIRDLCVFAVQNVVNDPPFSRVNLISCRNLLIYFGDILQKKVILTFHYALNSSGYLLLGSSESLGKYEQFFTLTDKKNKIYTKKSVKIPHIFNGNFTALSERLFEGGPHIDKSNDEVYDEKQLLSTADRLILNKYAPPGFVINDDLEILQIRGDTTPFIGIAPGSPTFNITKLLKKELGIPIRTLVYKAARTRRMQKESNLKFGEEGSQTSTTVIVIPLKLQQMKGNYFIILFENANDKSEKQISKINTHNGKAKLSTASEKNVKRLEGELTDAKERLQAIIEEYETTNEELKSTNEELLSNNEELQSTNEELQTAKEEIQSANEELSTMNEELQNRNDDLARSNDDFDNLIKSTRLPLIMLGRDLKIRRFSPATKEIFSIIPSDIGRPVTDIRASFDVTQLGDYIEEVIHFTQPKMLEIQSTSGIWYSMQIRPYISAENKIDGAVITFINIHSLKMMVTEDILLYAEDIVQTVREPILVLNSSLKVQMANNSFYNFFNTNQENTLGRNITELANQEWDVPALTELIDKVVKKHEIFEDFELSADFKGIGKRNLLVSGREIYRHEVGTKLILISLLDVTEKLERDFLKVAKASAEAASEAKSSFLANMSHEIRTPLSSIIGFADILGKEKISGDKQSEYINTIRRNGKHLLDLINDILDLSKIEAKQIQVESKALSVQTEVESVLSMLRSKAESKGLTLKTTYEQNFPNIVNSDPTKMRQILCNLVGNAIKFTKKGEVDLKIGCKFGAHTTTDNTQRGILYFFVSDTGCGMTETQVSNIFNPFSQAMTSTFREYGGTGLGLALSKKLAQLLGGDVILKKTQPGKGSTFEAKIAVSMPLKANKNSKVLKEIGGDQEEIQSELSNKRILIVEDNEDVRTLFSHILEHTGAKILVAVDGEEAITIAREENPDAILMDIQLPKINGYEATQIIRNSNSSVPIIALTAHALESERSKCLSQGFNDYRSKPVPPNDLIRLLSRWTKKE